jgi:hypothetical protein
MTASGYRPDMIIRPPVVQSAGAAFFHHAFCIVRLRVLIPNQLKIID